VNKTTEIMTLEDASFLCKVCAKSFEDEQLFIEHMKTHGSNISKDILKYYCSQCEYKCSKEGDLQEHIKKHEKDVSASKKYREEE
jgi:hypothetical protein